MRFLEGDVCINKSGCEQIFSGNDGGLRTEAVLGNGWRLLRTAREEWDRVHGMVLDFEGEPICVGASGSECMSAEWDDRIDEPVCPAHPYPTDPRPASEIAALKAGKAVESEPAPQMTREEWDARHGVVSHDGMIIRISSTTECCGANRTESGPGCDTCGPRPPAQPVATEWASVPISSEPCSKASAAYQIRWPSGVIGEGEPEFRKVGTEPAVVEPKPSDGMAQWNKMTAAVARRWAESEERIILGVLDAPAAVVEHVHLRELHEQWSPSPRREGPIANCPHCRQMFPAEVGIGISAGTLDCPSCGWHAGRCGHCNTKLVNSYVRGERDHGRTHCPRCQGVDLD